MKQQSQIPGTVVWLCLFLIVSTSDALSRERSGSGAALRSKASVQSNNAEVEETFKWPDKTHGFLTSNFAETIAKVELGSDSSAYVRGPLPLSTADAARTVKNIQASALGYWPLIVMSSVAWIMLVIVVAYNYKCSDTYFPEIGPVPEDPAKTRKTLSTWQFEWYQCADDADICFWSCCCPWIRWAHTMDLLYLIEYGPAFAVFFMLAMVNSLTGFALLGIYFTMLLVHYRQKVRKVFGMQNYGTCAGIFEDWLCLCFCLPCTIAQEAQHVKLAAEMGFPLPASMAEYGGRRKCAEGLSHGMFLDESDTDPHSSSSQSFHDVVSKASGSVGASPAMPQNTPSGAVFGGIFHATRSRSSSRGFGFRDAETRTRRSRSRSREPSTQIHVAAPKPKAITTLSHSASTGSIRRGAFHREAQNPMPERLLAVAPVRAGEQGEVRHGNIGFVQFLATLHDDLRAYAFLFVEVGCVGRSGATCRSLNNYIWADRSFWQFYCGPSVNDRLAQPWACPAHALREAFRRWIFHIDGLWTKDFRKFIDQARQSPSGADLSLMLSYARYIASGLMPYDSRPAVAEFTGIMCELLAEYNPEIPDERNAAEAMTAQVECMAEVFTGAQIRLVLSAFDCSLGRAVSDAPSANESDNDLPWVIPGEHAPPGDEAAPPWGDHAIMWFG